MSNSRSDSTDRPATDSTVSTSTSDAASRTPQQSRVIANPVHPEPSTSTKIILGSNFVLVILIFSLGSFFTRLRINECLLESHPVKILLLFSLVIGVVWATGMLMPSIKLARLLSTGAIMTVLIWAATILLLINNYYDEKWLGVKGRDNVAMAVIFIIISVLLLRALVNKRGGNDTSEMSAHAMKRWGELIALAIMMLAMFFLALEFKVPKNVDAQAQEVKDSNSQDPFKVKWEEIPAILMVFLLAELGVALVVKASLIRDGVKKAATLADNAVSRAEGVESTLTEARSILDRVERAASERIRELKEVAGGLTEIKIVSDSAPTLCRLANLTPAELWSGLNQFTNDWTPKSPNTGPEMTHPLVGVLFNKFIGGSTSGTVRSDELAVSCVTVDSVFADASTDWLNAMAQAVSRDNKKLVVWAVTSLLPTDFALPLVWWSDVGTGEGYGPPKRTKTLETFIGSVINECTIGQAVDEYRRVTVFPLSEKFVTSPSAPNNWQAKFAHSLDNWLLWDPRVQIDQKDSRFFIDRVQYCSTKLAKSAWEHWRAAGGTLKEPDVELSKITWELLSRLHASSLGTGNADTPELTAHDLKELRTLPDWTGQDSSALYFFHNDFGMKDGHPLTGGVISANDEFLNHSIEIKALGEFGLEQGLIDLINRRTQEDSITLMGIYKLLGWSSLREWYCNFLHRGNSKSQEGAWWAVSKHANLEQDPLLNPFKMPWDEYKVVTLDLLLIGTSPESTDNPEPTWYGAAFSNITFDRTECTIRLVTNQEELERIAGAVKKLCGNFTTATTEDVSSYGTWRDWPTPTDKAKEKSRPAAAG